jgi:hypothetical protein
MSKKNEEAPRRFGWQVHDWAGALDARYNLPDIGRGIKGHVEVVFHNPARMALSRAEWEELKVLIDELFEANEG